MSETTNKPKIPGAIVLLDGDHSGRDEMNLAGNPFALLQAASKSGQTFLRREWKRTLGNGRVVNAIWHVDGHTTLGLPGPSEIALYLVLLQLTREEKEKTGQWPQTINFSRGEVLRRMGWQDGTKEYNALRDAFFRLQAVAIQTEWAWHDARTGAPIPAIGVGILGDFVLADEKVRREQGALPLSWFSWNKVVFDSICAGNLRSLALDFVLSLQLPTSINLFRLLELFRHRGKPPATSVSLETFDLRDRLGMTAYAYPSKVREKLAPAVAELIERGYLERLEVEKDKKKGEQCVFYFAKISAQFPSPFELLTPQFPDAAPKTASGTAKTKKSGVRKTEGKTKSARNASAQTESSGAEELSTREVIARGHAVWQSLSDKERDEFRTRARKNVEPDFWDRLEVPESPISECLFRLVWEERKIKN